MVQRVLRELREHEALTVRRVPLEGLEQLEREGTKEAQDLKVALVILGFLVLKVDLVLEDHKEVKELGDYLVHEELPVSLAQLVVRVTQVSRDKMVCQECKDLQEPLVHVVLLVIVVLLVLKDQMD